MPAQLLQLHFLPQFPQKSFKKYGPPASRQNANSMRSPESGVSPPTVATISEGNSADGMDVLRLPEPGADAFRQSAISGERCAPMDNKWYENMAKSTNQIWRWTNTGDEQCDVLMAFQRVGHPRRPKKDPPEGNPGEISLETARQQQLDQCGRKMCGNWQNWLCWPRPRMPRPMGRPPTG